MNKAAIIIERCTECPHCVCNRYYTPDSFEHEFKYECYCMHPVKQITITDKECFIPDWCPCISYN